MRFCTSEYAHKQWTWACSNHPCIAAEQGTNMKGIVLNKKCRKERTSWGVLLALCNISCTIISFSKSPADKTLHITIPIIIIVTFDGDSEAKSFGWRRASKYHLFAHQLLHGAERSLPPYNSILQPLQVVIKSFASAFDFWTLRRKRAKIDGIYRNVKALSL